MPDRTDIRFHIAVMNEQRTVWMECKVVSVAETAGNHLDLLARQLQSDDGTTWCLDPLGMPTWIFEARLYKIAFVCQSIRTAFIDGCAKSRMISNHDVDTTIRTKGDLMWSMLSRDPLEL